MLQDRYIPSHSSVRLASAQYVKDNTVDELALVAANVKARKRPGLKFWKMEKQRLRKLKQGKCK